MSTGAYWRLLYRIVPARTAVPVGIVAGVAGYAAPAATPPEGSRQLMVAPLGVASTGIIGGMGLLAIAGVPVTQARWIVDDREAIRRILTEGPASGHVARAGRTGVGDRPRCGRRLGRGVHRGARESTYRALKHAHQRRRGSDELAGWGVFAVLGRGVPG